MKVLVLAPSKSIHTHKWATYYKQQGIDVTVVTFKDHYSEKNAKEINTEVLPKLLPGKLSYIMSVIALKKILKTYKPDILHAHYASSYGFIGALTQYHPFFVSVWGTDVYQFPQKNTVNRKILEYTLRQANVVCSTSKVMGEETKKYTDKPIEITPFGVDLTKFKPLDTRAVEDTLTIGTVKALSDNYGIGDLIHAFSQVHSTYTNTRLLIVGEGPQRAEYEDLVQRLNLKDVVTFTGKVPNDEVPNYINQIDIFAVPSTERESFGVAVVEAMACGVPVVVSDVGGLPEVVKDGETGIIVPKRNPSKLAEAFVSLIKDDSKRAEMGTNGIQHVEENYNWTDNANGMISLYNQIVKE